MASTARQDILDAADRLFGELGFDAASTREIAELSGVNKALIHYHYKNKEGLFVAVLDRYYESLNELLLDAMKKPGSTRDKLAAILDVYVDFLARNRNFSKIVQRESSGGKHMDRVTEHLEPVFKLGVKLLEDAYPATRRGPLAAHHLLVSFYGLTVSYFTYSGVLESLIGRDPLSRNDLDERKEHLHKMIDLMVAEIEKAEHEKAEHEKGRAPGERLEDTSKAPAAKAGTEGR